MTGYAWHKGCVVDPPSQCRFTLSFKYSLAKETKKTDPTPLIVKDVQGIVLPEFHCSSADSVIRDV